MQIKCGSQCLSQIIQNIHKNKIQINEVSAHTKKWGEKKRLQPIIQLKHK